MTLPIIIMLLLVRHTTERSGGCGGGNLVQGAGQLPQIPRWCGNNLVAFVFNLCEMMSHFNRLSSVMTLQQNDQKAITNVLCLIHNPAFKKVTSKPAPICRYCKAKHFLTYMKCTEIWMNFKRNLQSSSSVWAFFDQFNFYWTLPYVYFNILSFF